MKTPTSVEMPYRGNTRKKFLFVCSGNVCRSPTFEYWFRKNKPEYEVSSTGTMHSPHSMSRHELFAWADTIFVMDLSHEVYIARYFPEFLEKVEIVGISDQYDPEEYELILLIEYWVKKRGL